MVGDIEVKSVLNKHKKRDAWFLDDYSINLYEGCPINCLYCYIRGSKYGENMAETFSVKVNAPEILDRQLKARARKGEFGFVVVSSATDPYPPIEKERQLTRKALEILLAHRFPVHVITKSTMVLRDLDLLREIDSAAIVPEDLKTKLGRGVIISFSISTLDEEITRVLEPGAPTPLERLETLRSCSKEGFLAGLNCIPALPYLSDSDVHLEDMIRAAREYGADFILIGGLTLFGKGPSDSRTLFYRFLERYRPDLVVRYKSLYRIFPMPPKEHQAQLESRATSLAVKHGIRRSIAA